MKTSVENTNRPIFCQRYISCLHDGFANHAGDITDRYHLGDMTEMTCCTECYVKHTIISSSKIFERVSWAYARNIYLNLNQDQGAASIYWDGAEVM